MLKRFALAFLSALTVAVGIAILAVSLSADTSQTYGPLAQSPAFRQRVSWMLAFTSPVILTEAATGTYTAPCHTKRAALAALVAANPDGYAGIFASHLAAAAAITGAGALTGTLAAGTLDTPANDATVFSAVSAAWSTVAGCITNP